MNLTVIRIFGLAATCLLIYFGSNWSRKKIEAAAKKTEKTFPKLALRFLSVAITVASALIAAVIVFAIVES